MHRSLHTDQYNVFLPGARIVKIECQVRTHPSPGHTSVTFTVDQCLALYCMMYVVRSVYTAQYFAKLFSFCVHIVCIMSSTP